VSGTCRSPAVVGASHWVDPDLDPDLDLDPDPDLDFSLGLCLSDGPLLAAFLPIPWIVLLQERVECTLEDPGHVATGRSHAAHFGGSFELVHEGLVRREAEVVETGLTGLDGARLLWRPCPVGSGAPPHARAHHGLRGQMHQVLSHPTLRHPGTVGDEALEIPRCQMGRQLAGNRERNLLPGERVENQWMADADSAHLDSKCGTAFAQPQALGAVLEQTSISQLQVKLPQVDLRKMRDQPRASQMFSLGEELGLTLELERREPANLLDERGE